MKDKVVVITGASSGIGRACAMEMAKKKVKIVLAARNKKKLEEIEAAIRQTGTEALLVTTDVTKEADCRKLIETTVSHFGRIDILINNAGISMRALFKDTDIEVIKKLMDVNFWGTVYCTKYALPHLIKSKGSLAGVISIAGYVGLPARSAYSASKFAIRGFLDTLRIEHLKDELHVLVAAPGFTTSNIRNIALDEKGKQQGETPRDENKMMTAETCAKHIVKAIEKRKREIILTFWEGKFTVWLQKRVPSLLDKLIYKHMAKEPNSPLH